MVAINDVCFKKLRRVVCGRVAIDSVSMKLNDYSVNAPDSKLPRTAT